MQAEITGCELLLRTMNETMQDGTLDDGEGGEGNGERKTHGRRERSGKQTSTAHSRHAPAQLPDVACCLWVNGAGAPNTLFFCLLRFCMMEEE